LVQLKKDKLTEKEAKERLKNSININDKEKLKLTERITQYGKDITQLKELYM
jgi:hypothetical protein